MFVVFKENVKPGGFIKKFFASVPMSISLKYLSDEKNIERVIKVYKQAMLSNKGPDVYESANIGWL